MPPRTAARKREDLPHPWSCHHALRGNRKPEKYFHGMMVKEKKEEMKRLRLVIPIHNTSNSLTELGNLPTGTLAPCSPRCGVFVPHNTPVFDLWLVPNNYLSRNTFTQCQQEWSGLTSNTSPEEKRSLQRALLALL